MINLEAEIITPSQKYGTNHSVTAAKYQKNGELNQKFVWMATIWVEKQI
jgi:hypothetical protein